MMNWVWLEKSVWKISVVGIINKNNTMSVLQIGWYKTTISLLPCSIPHLQSIILPILINILDIKIYSYSGLII